MLDSFRCRTTGDPLSLSLLSDLHVGSTYTDYAAIRRDVDAAIVNDRIVCIAGDVFDAILPSDKKRFSVENLHPRVRVDDVLGASIAWAEELLAPVADRIAFISRGNHDTAVTKHHAIDPVAELCRRLSVYVAPYAGIAQFRVGSVTLNLGYWHGAGGGSSRQSAVKQSARLLDVFDGLDAAWTGHRHQRYAAPVPRFTATRNGVKERKVWLVMSGAYLRGSPYSTEALHPPGDVGGVVLTARQHGKKLNTEVTL